MSCCAPARVVLFSLAYLFVTCLQQCGLWTLTLSRELFLPLCSDGRVAPDWPWEPRQAGAVLHWVSSILWTHPSFLVRNVRFPCGCSASALQPVLSPRGGEHPGMRSGCHCFWALAALSAPSTVAPGDRTVSQEETLLGLILLYIPSLEIGHYWIENTFLWYCVHVLDDCHVRIPRGIKYHYLNI